MSACQDNTTSLPNAAASINDGPDINQNLTNLIVEFMDNLESFHAIAKIGAKFPGGYVERYLSAKLQTYRDRLHAIVDFEGPGKVATPMSITPKGPIMFIITAENFDALLEDLIAGQGEPRAQSLHRGCIIRRDRILRG